MSQHPAPVAIAHAADFYRRYPGETVTFYTRVDVLQPIAGFTLRVNVPEGLVLTEAPEARAPQLVYVDGERYCIWTVKRDLRPGERVAFQLPVIVAPTERDLALTTRAVVVADSRSAGGEPPAPQAEAVTIAVAAKGRLLKHLPALYTDQDELMGRLVMLFESFWEPITDRIDHIDHYFDPRLTPPDMLPWLATWVDLVLDEQWPEDKRRLLLRAMVPLYRQRGTRRGLQAYLEIYTGRLAHIVEHRAHNFQLGPMTRLGPSAALGQRNVPHTFEVILQLPPVDEPQRRERRRKIEAIIESEKPAHTAYTLIINETA